MTPHDHLMAQVKNGVHPQSYFINLVAENMEAVHAELVRLTTELVNGIPPAPDIHEHFMIHKWLRSNAYIFTHNLNNLEHIATNCMSAMTHTDVTTAHH